MRREVNEPHAPQPLAEACLAYAAFTVIGTLTIAAPVVIYLTMGDRSAQLLAHLKNWMSRHNAVIMSVLCLVIGAKLIGDSLTGLTR